MSTVIVGAIARSISHNEIVHVTCTAHQLDALLADADDYVENGDVTEAWGTDDGSEWRVHATVRAPVVTVGGIVKVYNLRKHDAYVAVAIQIDGTPQTVACVVGVAESDWGTADACGSERGMISAHWEDSSDWERAIELGDHETRDALLSALIRESSSLLRAARAF